MADEPIDVDRLRRAAPVEVMLMDGFRVGEGPIRAPHRHGYHELILVRDGRGEQAIDDVTAPVRPGTVTVIGQGQVHQFRWAEDLRGGVVRFTDAALEGGGRIPAGRLLSGRGGRTIALPPGEVERADALVRLLAGEVARPPDPYAAGVQQHLLGTLLLWLERWYDASRSERDEVDDADVQLHRRFAERLEADFARHHDVAHYADALAVPGAALRQGAAAAHRPHDEGAHPRPRDARGGAAAALHRPHRRRRSRTASATTTSPTSRARSSGTRAWRRRPSASASAEKSIDPRA